MWMGPVLYVVAGGAGRGPVLIDVSDVGYSSKIPMTGRCGCDLFRATVQGAACGHAETQLCERPFAKGLRRIL